MLATERLRLLPWEEEDWHELQPIATDPKVMCYITGGLPWPETEIREFVARQRRHFTERSFCLWKLLPAAGGPLVGFCGLQPLTLAGAAEVEIGWWLAKDRWGMGLATEAAQAALRDGFERAGLTRIIALARADNAASLRVMQKLGMRHERNVTHKDVPVVLYSIRAAEAKAKALPNGGRLHG